MTISRRKRSVLWTAILMLIISVGLPAVAFADPPQGKGKNKHKISHQQKKAEKFKNGHDARDGRWDGRGPQDRDNDGDDDRDGRRGRRRDNDRDNDGINDRTEIRRQALSIGYREGYSAGRDDRASGRNSGYNNHSAYRDGTIGYQNSYGDVSYYRNSFREGFRQGYADGYGNRSSRSGRWGEILGDIFGRP